MHDPWKAGFRVETASVAYPLPAGAAVAVAVGDAVNGGDMLAEIPAAPRVIAVADELRLAPGASRAAIRALDGRAVEAGAALGSHRVGLRTRTLRAPCAGSVQGVPEYGAALVRPSEGRAALRADHPGVVAAIEADTITIERVVIRRPFAFATGSRRDLGRLAIAEDARGREAGAERTTALPHIGDVAEIAGLLRAAPGPLIVGTVSDSAAWALLTREPPARRGPERMVVVLLGPGDAERGAAALRHLRQYDGAALAADHHACEIILSPDHPPDNAGGEISQEHRPREAVYVDPARWFVPCIADGAAAMRLLDTGQRTWVVRTTGDGFIEGNTPLVNLGNPVES